MSGFWMATFLWLGGVMMAVAVGSLVGLTASIWIGLLLVGYAFGRACGAIRRGGE